MLSSKPNPSLPPILHAFHLLLPSPSPLNLPSFLFLSLVLPTIVFHAFSYLFSAFSCFLVFLFSFPILPFFPWTHYNSSFAFLLHVLLPSISPPFLSPLWLSLHPSLYPSLSNFSLLSSCIYISPSLPSSVSPSTSPGLVERHFPLSTSVLTARNTAGL